MAVVKSRSHFEHHNGVLGRSCLSSANPENKQCIQPGPCRQDHGRSDVVVGMCFCGLGAEQAGDAVAGVDTFDVLEDDRACSSHDLTGG